MARRSSSLRDSVRTAVHDYSLLVAAGVLVLFGYALSQHVIPNYHELKALELRRDDVRKQVEQQAAVNERLRDEISALEDPYYLAGELVNRYHWRYPPLEVPLIRPLDYHQPAADSIIPPPPSGAATRN